MLSKIFQHVEKHAKKFNYQFSESEKEELAILYELNHDNYDEGDLSLYIEYFIKRAGVRDEQATWASERRPSVVAKRVDPGVFEMPSYIKSAKVAEFLTSALGSGIPFSFLSSKQKVRLVSSMYPLIVEANTVLIHQGEIGSEMYIVEKGEFDVIIDGRFVKKLLPGSKFGELALMHEIPRTATVKAVKPSKVWATEQTSFSCIRIRDIMYKKALIRDAIEANYELDIFQNNPLAVSQAISVAQSRIFLANSAVQLQSFEILIVAKDAQIQRDGNIFDVHAREIIRESFLACTDLECVVINITNIKK
ncbi:cAMP-dependent protein kinase regulator [Pancytospora epiphaga]|nr:cAMP-dependent protein kinase regulator [Pancytospora epiphaga]